MLEILGIILLSNKNKANAIKRGRKPGMYIFLTIALWLGFEFIGAMVGAAMGLEAGAYLLSIVFAIMGGALSYVIASNCKPGDYVPPEESLSQSIALQAQALSIPADITLIRDKSMVGALVRWDFTLNGQAIGSLKNGENLRVQTFQNQNMLRAKDAYGNEAAPYVFNVADGTYVQIHFKINKFLPQLSQGIQIPTASTAIGGQVNSQTLSPLSAPGPKMDEGPASLLVRFSIEKLNELTGSYGFQSGKLIGRAVGPELLAGMTISDGDSAATLRGQEYICIVSISTLSDASVLKDTIEPLILASEEIKACGAHPLAQIVRETREPLVINGVVRDGEIIGRGGWCASGFMDAWKDRDREKNPSGDLSKEDEGPDNQKIQASL